MKSLSGQAPAQRRLDVQVLRGIAVLGVMLAHFGAMVPGGFLGVDVFFVISGFVITLSAIKLASQSASARAFLLSFWRRRFFRLFPVLTVVIAVTLLTAVFVLPPVDFFEQVKMSLWSLAFAGNIGVEVLSRADYFDPAAEQNWFLHLWSLGVEEQFYLLFPLIFLVVVVGSWGRAHLRLALGSIIGLAGLSFALALVNEMDAYFGLFESVVDSTGVAALVGYYSPLTRAWQFLVGVIAALLIYRGVPRTSPVLTVVGMVGLVSAFVVTPQSNLLPGPITGLTVGAVFLLLISPVSHPIASSVGLAPLRWLGDRSYSAYLWHWPVWLTASQFLDGQLSSIAVSFGVTLVLSALSYRWIERPFIAWGAQGQTTARHLSAWQGWRHSGKRVAAVLLPLPLLVGLAPVGAHAALEDRGLLITPDPVPRIDGAEDCLKADCTGLDIDVLVIGDSHAGSLYGALNEELSQRNLSVRGAIVARQFGCLHLPSTEIVSIHEECQELSQSVRDLLIELSPRFVVIHGYTTGRFTQINSGGDSEIQLVDAEAGVDLTEQTAVEGYQRALVETIALIEAAGATPVLVSDVPDFEARPQEILAPNSPASQATLLLAPWSDFRFGQTLPRSELAPRHEPFRVVEANLAKTRPTLTLIDSWDYLCDDDYCSQTTPDGYFLFADQDHVSPLGAQLLAAGIGSELEQQGLID